MLAIIAASIDKVTSAYTYRIIGVPRDVGDIIEASEGCGVGLNVKVFVLNTATGLLEFLKIVIVTATIHAYSCEAHIVFEPVDSAYSAVVILAN